MIQKASDVFKVGINNIGWVDSDFTKEFGNVEITEGRILPFQKLRRIIYDSEIISELKVQECTLGDVLATMQNATEDMKDGYSNIFYISGHPSHVVRVGWRDSGWRVGTWPRGHYWSAGLRVFSPANDSGTLKTSPESPVTLEFCECKRCGQCGKLEKVMERK